MVGSDTTLQGGLVAALVLFIANFGLKKLMFNNEKLKHLIQDQPEVLVKDDIADFEKLKKA